jgi:hypothetical protein
LFIFDSRYGFKKEEEKSGEKVNRFWLQVSATDPVFDSKEKNDCGFLLTVKKHAVVYKQGI